MSIIVNMDMEISLEPEEDFTQSNTSIPHSGTITLNNSGNMSQEPTMNIQINDTLTSITITNITTGISATIPSTTLSAGLSLTVFNDAIYRNNSSGSLSTELSAAITGIFNLSENATNTISFGLVPSTGTSVNATSVWKKPNGNAVLQCFAEGFSINKNKSQIRKKSNILNHYSKGNLNQDIDYDFNFDRLFFDDQFINEEDDDQTYRITYKTNESVGAIEHQIYHLCGCSFSSYGINQSSTQQTDACKENIRGKGCRLIKG